MFRVCAGVDHRTELIERGTTFVPDGVLKFVLLNFKHPESIWCSVVSRGDAETA